MTQKGANARQLNRKNSDRAISCNAVSGASEGDWTAIGKHQICDKITQNLRSRSNGDCWRVPNPPGANPLVAERVPWRSSQSGVAGGQQPIGNPYRFLSFLLHTWQSRETPMVTRGEGSFSYQGVSTRGLGTRQDWTPGACLSE